MDDYFVPDADDRALAELTRERELWEQDEAAQKEYRSYLAALYHDHGHERTN